MAFAPVGSTLATAGEGGLTLLWDAEAGTQQRALAAREGQVRTVAFSPDGHWLASGTSEGMIRIWDLAASGGESTTAIRVDDTVSGCTWAKTGTVLYAVGARGLYRFSLHPS
jgi:WD40 repeat protein